MRTSQTKSYVLGSFIGWWFLCAPLSLSLGLQRAAGRPFCYHRSQTSPVHIKNQFSSEPLQASTNRFHTIYCFYKKLNTSFNKKINTNLQSFVKKWLNVLGSTFPLFVLVGRLTLLASWSRLNIIVLGVLTCHA